VELVTESHREERLRQALKSITERYDYILVDCPPSLGLLTVNGLMAAANGLIIPVQCEYLALEGISLLMQTIQRVRNGLFHELVIRGVLLTMYDARTKLSNDVVSEVRRYFPHEVFQAVIPRSVRLAEAPSYGQPINIYAPNSSGALAYADLAREVLEKDDVLETLSVK
jgi:chromosome partitioning protein